MDDRELLELAAKAIGKELVWSSASDVWPLLKHGPGIRGIGKKWNPLESDGDALGLAVDLEMRLVHELRDTGTVTANWKSHACIVGAKGYMAVVRHGDDKHAATRRAIVMAAAKIGRDM